MCFSERWSYAALLVGATGIGLSIARAERERRDRKFVATDQRYALIATSVLIVVVQLYEAMLWRGIRLKSGRMVTMEYLVVVTVLAQAVLAGGSSIVVRIRNRDAFPSYQIWVLAVLTAVYVIMAAAALLQLSGKMPPITANDCGVGCRLNWDWSNNMPIWVAYHVLVSAVLAFVQPPRSAAVLTGFLLAAVAVSWFLLPKPYGSKWCFIAVLLPWIVWLVDLEPAQSASGDDGDRMRPRTS